jgi:hypothetical protein
MTPQEIQERNKQIALMLGYENMSPDKLLLFHSDWNWLMEAKSFINNKLYQTYQTYYPHTNRHQFSIWKESNCLLETIDIDEKEAVFIAVSDFAKLYNEGKL